MAKVHRREDLDVDREQRREARRGWFGRVLARGGQQFRADVALRAGNVNGALDALERNPTGHVLLGDLTVTAAGVEQRSWAPPSPSSGTAPPTPASSAAPLPEEPAVAHLAQVNAAVLRWPVDDPRLADFVAAVDHIHRLAEVAPGFVWRHPDAHRELLDAQGVAEGAGAGAGAGVTVVNLSIWSDYEALHEFVYRHEHGLLVRRRGRWFRPTAGPTTALWWVQEHERPDPPAALARLRYLRRVGPTPRAFTVRRRFTPDGRPEPRRRR